MRLRRTCCGVHAVLDGWQSTQADQVSRRLVIVIGQEIGGLDQPAPARILLRRQSVLVNETSISTMRQEQRSHGDGLSFIVGQAEQRRVATSRCPPVS